MQLDEFKANIEAHPTLEIFHEEAGGYGVRRGEGEDATEYSVLLEAVEANEWDVLRDVLTGEREPRMLDHMTRVCGYYAKRANMNLSKHGEWKARRNGDYLVPGNGGVNENV